MFRSSGKQKSARVDSLIGKNTEVEGNIKYRGGLHVDGKVKGNVVSDEDKESILSVSESGVIEGDVRVSHIVLNGTVKGDVYALERIELAINARVTGNVYYNLIEMAMGSEVNGSLVHQAEQPKTLNVSVDEGKKNAKDKEAIVD